MPRCRLRTDPQTFQTFVAQTKTNELHLKLFHNSKRNQNIQFNRNTTVAGGGGGGAIQGILHDYLIVPIIYSLLNGCSP